MRSAALAFLLIGFGIGFGVVYPWTRNRAPEIARPLPEWVPPRARNAPPPPDPAVVKRLEAEVQKDPRNFEALRELGNLKYDGEDFAGAAAMYTKALEVRPDDVNVRTDRGTALYRANRVEDSIAELQKVLVMSPTHPQALFSLGMILLQAKNDRPGALALWNKLIETNPDFPDIATVKEVIREVENSQKRQ
jgi:cytochrome c-type biogenesis protein CcmH/NrfG